MTIYIKDLGIIIGSIFFFIHLLHLPFTKRNAIGYSAFAVTLMAIIPYLDNHYPQFILATLPIVSLLLTVCIQTDYDIVLNTTVISFALSYIFFMAAALIVALIHICIMKGNLSRTFLQLATLIVQWCLMPIPFLFARTRKGMPFLRNKTYSFPCMILSLAIVICSMFLNDSPHLIFIQFSYLALLPIILLIYYYWRNLTTKTYLDKLSTNNIHALNDELARKEQQIMQLTTDNERLSALVHKDNKLIPAMEYAVEQFLSTPGTGAGSTSSATSLIQDLHQLMSERKGLLVLQDMNCEPLPDTGNSRVNYILAYLQQKAFSWQIALQVTPDSSCTPFLNSLLSEDAFCTLIADLVENALIATRYADGGHVLVALGVLDGCPALHVFDSGIPFSAEVLLKYGKESITTHADDAGSGIGLMQTATLLTNHNASLYIEEFPSGMYTKKVSVVFDQHGSYTLYTSRTEEELAPLKKRLDLIIVRK